MFMVVTFPTLLIYLVSGTTTYRTCAPNTQFLLNGRLCYCNSMGFWTEATCQAVSRRQTCQPGQIIWEECSQCICQDNGQLLCTNTQCSKRGLRNGEMIDDEQWCTPFRSYYVNCSLCVCPASGKMTESRCATDSSCTLKGNLSLEDILKEVCIPKVMYLFPCQHCLCSDDGFFTRAKCVETCTLSMQPTKRCTPKTFYRVQCNVCRCPESGIPDNSLCTKSICHHPPKLESLDELRNGSSRCVPNKFTKPKCYYCECVSHGPNNQITDENACIELECFKIADYNYELKNTCSAGEVVPVCSECFCPRSGFTFGNLCTRVCSVQSKLHVLETVVLQKPNLIDRIILKEKAPKNEACDPNSIFFDRGRYCLCPEGGETNLKVCTAVVEETHTEAPLTVSKENVAAIDYNAPCEPSTLVDFGCNTCYCGKNGRVDPKWCTFDDCDAKRMIQDFHKSRLIPVQTETAATCTPGSISKVKCNFCICGDNGLIKDRACTKNVCTGSDNVTGNELICEPSVYYTVDCNICYCPADGVKNLGKCTKNQCEVNFLRSETCLPGELFSDDCNICICPQNGEKKDKACTNRKCSEMDTPWKKIFKISQTLLGNQVAEDTTRNLDLCFPGEEFEDGCKVCACPDMGLREYATCTPMLCGDNQSTNPPEQSGDEKKTDKFARTKRESEVASCITYNITDSAERKECTPGSMYIVRCRQCICPYMGNINHFCRPLPKGYYCEQAYPNVSYLPMGRRNGTVIPAPNASLATNISRSPTQISVDHHHTEYTCLDVGKQVSDDCYICECEGTGLIIFEHCFKNDAEECLNASATFLTENNRI